MKHLLLSLTLLALALPAASDAAVSMHIDVLTGGSSEGLGSVTLTFRVTANGGEVDNTIFARLQYDNTRLAQPPAHQLSQFALGPDWSAPALTCTSIRCTIFSQFRQDGPTAINRTGFEIATITFLVLPGAGGPGVYPLVFEWVSTPSTLSFDFFGLTPEPRFCVTNYEGLGPCPVIPEPTTAALLGVGLLGLAFARRRRT